MAGLSGFEPGLGARLPVATVDPDAIRWVTLVRVGSRVGPAGGTTLSDTTFVQRVNTRGGLAPSTGCDQLSNLEPALTRVDYFV
jgi:hypothetical protein